MSSSIHIGDCIEVMSHMESDSVDLVVTSPPYNAQKRYEKTRLTRDEYQAFTEKWLAQVCRVTKPGCNIFINIGYWSGSRSDRYFLPELFMNAAKDLDMKMCGWINWVKQKDGLSQTRGCGWGDTYGTSPFFMNGSEPILHFRTAGKRAHRDNKHPEWMKLVREP